MSRSYILVVLFLEEESNLSKIPITFGIFFVIRLTKDLFLNQRSGSLKSQNVNKITALIWITGSSWKHGKSMETEKWIKRLEKWGEEELKYRKRMIKDIDQLSHAPKFSSWFLALVQSLSPNLFKNREGKSLYEKNSSIN